MSGSDSLENEPLVPRLLRDLSEHERTRTAAGGASGSLAAPPPTLSRFEIQESIGQGATAVFYRARDGQLNRTVAVKVLRESPGMSEVVRERFRREGKAAAGLAHPNVVTGYDAGEESGVSYLIMELVEGRPLDQLMKDPKGDLLPL